MAKKLTAKQVESDSGPPFASDGDNLYLRRKNGGKSWAFVFRLGGRQHELELGKAGKDHVSLADARAKAAEGRRLLNMKPKIDPRSVWGMKAAKGDEKALTFGAAADALLKRQDERLIAGVDGGKNPKHRKQWHTSLGGLPKAFREMPVDQIKPEDVFGVLDPLWIKTRVGVTVARADRGGDRPQPRFTRHAPQPSRLDELAEDPTRQGQAARQDRS